MQHPRHNDDLLVVLDQPDNRGLASSQFMQHMKSVSNDVADRDRHVEIIAGDELCNNGGVNRKSSEQPNDERTPVGCFPRRPIVGVMKH